MWLILKLDVCAIYEGWLYARGIRALEGVPSLRIYLKEPNIYLRKITQISKKTMENFE